MLHMYMDIDHVGQREKQLPSLKDQLFEYYKKIRERKTKL